MADQATAWRRRRPLENRNKTWMGIVAVLVTALLVGTLLLVKVANFGYRQYTAHFLQAAALQVGNPVTVAGIPVGEVMSLDLAGDHVEANLKVRNDVVLGQDSRAS
ncbi:MAG TPA: MlaD family protein, partial [Pseudonocardiaceae bacterium]|nr:MlaD family protein [Pseudonocardiaceae bacterium]